MSMERPSFAPDLDRMLEDMRERRFWLRGFIAGGLTAGSVILVVEWLK